MYHVEADGSITAGLRMADCTSRTIELRHLYATLVGALRDPRCTVEATAIKTIKREAFYDAAEVMANDWKVEGLTPTHHATIIELEEDN